MYQPLTPKAQRILLTFICSINSLCCVKKKAFKLLNVHVRVWSHTQKVLLILPKKQFFRSSKAVVSRVIELRCMKNFCSLRNSYQRSSIYTSFDFCKHWQSVDAGKGEKKMMKKWLFWFFDRKMLKWRVLYQSSSSHSHHHLHVLFKELPTLPVNSSLLFPRHGNFSHENSFKFSSFRQPATIDLWMTLLMKQQEQRYKLTEKRSQEHKLD